MSKLKLILQNNDIEEIIRYNIMFAYFFFNNYKTVILSKSFCTIDMYINVNIFLVNCDFSNVV